MIVDIDGHDTYTVLYRMISMQEHLCADAENTTSLLSMKTK